MKFIKTTILFLLVTSLFCSISYSADSEAEFKAKYNLEIGTDVQAYDANLESVATNGPTPVSFMIDVSGDETTDLTIGTAKRTFRAPFAFTLTEVKASVTLAPTDATLNVDLNEGGTTVFSTVITIDSTELTSTTAVAPAVISDSDIATDAVLTIDVDQVGSTIAGDGLKIWLIGTMPL